MQLLTAIPGFALAALLIVLIPGQGMAMVLRQTLVGGQRVAFLTVAGNSTGVVIWGAASAIGLSAIFATSPTAYNILKYTGVVYLLWVAGQTLWSLRGGSGGHFAVSDEAAAAIRSKSAYRTGLITNLTNAKAAVFAVAFVPRFVPEGSSVAVGVFVLCCVWALVSASTYSVIIAAIDRTSHLLSSVVARRRLAMVSAIGITFMAVGLMLS